MSEKLGRISKILVDGLEPSFYRVRFPIVTDYQWGRGWSSSLASFNFDQAIARAFNVERWSVRFPAPNDGGCITVRSQGQYLYLHPMEVTGYILPKNLSKIYDILSSIDKSIIYSVGEGKLEEGVYRLSDSNLIESFTKHRHEIWDIIAPVIDNSDTKHLSSVVFDELLKDAVVPRNNELSGIGLSSNCIEYAMLMNEAQTLIEMRNLMKQNTKDKMVSKKKNQTKSR